MLAGGGLANGLIAYRLSQLQPDVQVVILEREAAPGGSHVWCFHDSDVSDSQREWLAPFIVRHWESQDVRFPDRERTLQSGYNAITSERFREVISGVRGLELRTGVRVESLTPTSVRMEDGSTLTALAVIDGRGSLPDGSLHLRYQKFLGQWLELDEPHGLQRPILMDATVEQSDGFRFMYTLPFENRLLHVEDTRYSDSPAVDEARCRSDIEAYVRRCGWRPRAVRREERGVLPIVLGGNPDQVWTEGHPELPRAGLSAALFHPTTGYSLPQAVGLADAVAGSASLDAPALYRLTRARSKRLWDSGRYFRFLNRMLFRAAEPSLRYRVMQRFYGLPTPLIERFYAGTLTFSDQARVLSGRPPVPIHRAVACLFDAGRA